MSDEIKLPTTVEEFQRARREAFRAGVNHADNWHRNPDKDDPTAERLLYPIRKKVPRKVRLPNFGGSVERGGDDGEIAFLPIGTRDYMVYLRRDDVEAMLDLLERPYEEIEE